MRCPKYRRYSQALERALMAAREQSIDPRPEPLPEPRIKRYEIDFVKNTVRLVDEPPLTPDSP